MTDEKRGAMGKDSKAERDLDGPNFNLPESPEFFIGRKKLFVSINEARLRSDVVVLHGESGMGKTHLALEFAHWHKTRRSFGAIVWVDLENGGGYGRVIEEIGRALIGDGAVSKDVIDRLSTMPTLMVIDGYESAAGDDDLANFLRNLPKPSKALLTSTEPPSMGQAIPVGGLEEDEAVELFKILAARAGWDRTDEEHVAELCKELGGVPLFIELMASQAASTPIATILQGVKQSVDAISAEMKDLSPHHRTARGVFNYLYGTLKAEERLLLAAMAVFPGGAYPSHMTKLTERDEQSASSILGELNKRALIRSRDHRHWMHALVRQIALEKLEGEFKAREQYEEKFADLFKNLALAGSAALGTEHAAGAVNMTLLERDNLAQALAWFIKKLRYRDSLDLSNSFGILLHRAGLWLSSLDAHSKGLESAKELRDKRNMAVQCGNIGNILADLNQHKEAIEQHRRALAIDEELGNKQRTAQDYANIGNILADLKQPREALEHYNKALKIHEELLDKRGLAQDYGRIGIALARLGRPEEAIEQYYKALAMDEELGNKQRTAQDYANIGNILADLKQPREALEHYNKALKIHEELLDRQGAAIVTSNKGVVLMEMGEREKGWKLLEDALKTFREIGAVNYAERTLRMMEDLRKERGEASTR